MTPQERKAAITAYKERKTPVGVFAVRCAASGEVWVGSSRHLDTHKNSVWAALRLGSARRTELQAAWRKHGEAAFAFEALEELPAETSAYMQASLLKERAQAWRTRLGALSI